MKKFRETYRSREELPVHRPPRFYRDGTHSIPGPAMKIEFGVEPSCLPGKHSPSNEKEAETRTTTEIGKKRGEKEELSRWGLDIKQGSRDSTG